MPQIESWFGFVKDAECARLLVEAAIAGCIDAVSEYPLSTEFSRIRSGSVVVFAEYYKSDFMRTRWRDGFSWSSSKLCHPFLLYRQVERVSKKQMDNTHEQDLQPLSQFSITPSSLRPNTRIMRDGLCKRTISIRGSNGRFYRVISYFTAQDVSSFYGLRDAQTVHAFKLPSQDHRFKFLSKTGNNNTRKVVPLPSLRSTPPSEKTLERTQFNPFWLLEPAILAPIRMREMEDDGTTPTSSSASSPSASYIHA
ncbi:hypothetical protein HDU78_005184 [Chytriomyces hyalinus]|nr:hypothetical protein HDU78_005184 [Chytriomyces hyalinus]